MTEAVNYSVAADGICTLTMDVPGQKMNVLGEVLTTSLCTQFARAVADESVRAIILKSGKDSFIAGGDLNAMGATKDGPEPTLGERCEMYRTLSRKLRAIELAGKPIACIINGFALGGGLEVALACHYRIVIADPKSRLGLPEANVGLLPGGGGTQRLIRMIGVQAALPLIMQGQQLSPDKALKAGFVDAVVPADQAEAKAREWLLTVHDAVKPWDKKGFILPGGSSSLDRGFRNVFAGVIPITRANGYGNYPAPEKILAAIYEGAQVPFDTALGIEAKYFTQLMADPVSGNLIRTMFINKGKADNLVNRPKDVPKARFSTIGVVGAGTMGGGIAYCAAQAGIRVILIDRDLDAAERGKAFATRKLDREIEKGRKTPEQAEALLALIEPCTDFASLGEVQLVIETVFEDRAVKCEVLGRIAAAIPQGVLIASNTSGLPITELAEMVANPGRFIGMHFFSPVERMPLIEIIRGARTEAAAWAHALDFAAILRKTPITVNDGPGFFTSRFIGSFISASLDMLNEGINPALVENGARMVGMPMGALTISDSIGLDVGHKSAVAKARDDGREFVPSLMSKLVLAGRNGIKNGKGFFDYQADGTKRLWPGLRDLVPTLSEQPDVHEVKQRVLYAQLCEGARCFDQGILMDPIDGDIGACLGVGFPAYLGGPFAAMDTLGIANVVAEADRLTARYGAPYAVPQLLRDMAAEGRCFHQGERAAA